MKQIEHRSEILRDSVAWWLAHTGIHEKDQDSLFTDAGREIFDRLLLCGDKYDQVACDALGWISERARYHQQQVIHAAEHGVMSARYALDQAAVAYGGASIKAHISWGENPDEYCTGEAIAALISVFDSLEDRDDHYPEPEPLPVY